MPLRNHKQVMAGVEMLEGRSVKRIGKAYRERTIGPLVDAIRNAQTFEELRAYLGWDLTSRMDSGVLTDSLAETAVTAALIGRAAARPLRKPRTGSQRK